MGTAHFTTLVAYKALQLYNTPIPDTDTNLLQQAVSLSMAITSIYLIMHSYLSFHKGILGSPPVHSEN